MGTRMLRDGPILRDSLEVHRTTMLSGTTARTGILSGMTIRETARYRFAGAWPPAAARAWSRNMRRCERTWKKTITTITPIEIHSP
jgi:hypothetical protein